VPDLLEGLFRDLAGYHVKTGGDGAVGQDPAVVPQTVAYLGKRIIQVQVIGV